ncbi:YggT family protein [Marinitoga hydrogenitolerans DSM 16785]|uniref:YggT family protein n=1 Tax=Marinitoga hydrogenitolerans (strain DSM 16785 / JCM 12826 / AT1271) TaxID=1122195 RepID=A0A1M4SZ43_MARH1|nr:YggT family protein [Marinitoga hydrogenitolerans]SHE37430.1 YggT family protein [Marinitoga hydrogenitolerans DSM 16785]
MFILANLFYAIAVVLRITINFFQISLIISAIFSFISFNYHHPIRHFFDSIAEIVERPIRRYFNFTFGMVDFTPFVAILLLILLDNFLVNSLFDLARVLR